MAKVSRKTEEQAEEDTASLYTYIGGGEDSPRVIDFMGKQKFVRGQPTKVTDPEVLAKLKNHPTITQSPVDEEELHDLDTAAKKEADEQRKIDRQTQTTVDRAARKWAGVAGE